MNLKLRQYQSEALDKIDAAFAAGMKRPAVVLPTGMGKTVVFAELIRRTVDDGKRVVVLVHRDELAEQAKDKVHSAAPDALVGIVKAERNEHVGRDVVVCSVQTLARQRRREDIDPEKIGLVIVDECHHAAARTWQEVISYLDAPTVGFTATFYREDGKPLSDVWDEVVYEREIEYGIDYGYLVDVRGQQVDIKGLDLNSVTRARGDYTDHSLGEALLEADAGAAIAAAYKEFAADRRGVLFAPTVETAENFAAALNDAGIVTEVIIGSTSKEDRALIYKRYDAGEVQVLSNCMVLTEGWDSPATSCAVIARPTQNPALYMQCVGRVLRTFPGKEDALVLDVVGISESHKLQSLTKIVKSAPKDGESVREAMERVGLERERREIRGSAQAKQVELFAASHSAWLQTKGGTYFIPVRGGQVVLWEKDSGKWSVGKKMKGSRGEWLFSDITFDYAMAWGENVAEQLDPTVSSRDKAWRRGKPTDAQVDLAIRLKLAPVDELMNMRRGAVSDMLSVFFASKDLKALDAARKTVSAAS